MTVNEIGNEISRTTTVTITTAETGLPCHRILTSIIVAIRDIAVRTGPVASPICPITLTIPAVATIETGHAICLAVVPLLARPTVAHTVQTTPSQEGNPPLARLAAPSAVHRGHRRPASATAARVLRSVAHSRKGRDEVAAPLQDRRKPRRGLRPNRRTAKGRLIVPASPVPLTGTTAIPSRRSAQGTRHLADTANGLRLAAVRILAFKLIVNGV